jgi:hypothetical protein
MVEAVLRKPDHVAKKGAFRLFLGGQGTQISLKLFDFRAGRLTGDEIINFPY